MTCYVIPGGGLCNRLRVIKSTLETTADRNIKIVVLWRVNSELGCNYQHLFKELVSKVDTQHFQIINLSKINALYWLLHPKLLSSYKQLVTYINPYLTILLPEDTTTSCSASVKKSLQHSKIVLLHSYHGFSSFSNLSEFLPTKHLQQQIEMITSNFDEHTIGIHIRRTDNIEAIRSSPISLFMGRIEEIILANNAANFFLCTDDPMTKQELINKFPGKLLTRTIAYNREDKHAIEDAVIDLYSLSQTRQLLCSHYSSFSEIAALLGYQPKIVEVIKKH